VDRRAKVELFEQIRREYEHGGGTIRGITKKLGIHRRGRSFRSPTIGAKKRRWTGMKLTQISAESGSWPTYFACAAWPVEERSNAPSRTRASKRFWKRMNERFSISVEYLLS